MQQAKRKLPLTEEEHQTLQGIPMATMARWLRISVWRLPLLFWKGRSVMGQHIANVHPFPGMKEAVQQLHREGYNLFVLSSNSVQNIQAFLENNQMSTDFTKIYGGIGFLGKARVIRKLIRRNGLHTKNTVYIGDEARDVEAARRAGIGTVAVTWGYSNEVVLSEHNPIALAATPEELLKAIHAANEEI
jgi:phosphoglycolate phosphatase-like HAD superfamily hydrolase